MTGVADIAAAREDRADRETWWRQFVATAHPEELRAALAWLRSLPPPTRRQEATNPTRRTPTMTPDDQTRLARAALRTDVLRFAVGSTPEQVDALFDEIVSAWGMRADQLPVAVDILAHAAQLSRGAVIMWLHQTFLLMQTAAGRQIAMQLGARAAEIERGIAESATKH